MKGARRRRRDAHRIDWFKAGLRGVGKDCGWGWEKVVRHLINGSHPGWSALVAGSPSQLALEVSILMKGCPFVTCVNTRKEKVLRLVELAGVFSVIPLAGNLPVVSS
eukprot:scaffold22025_cov122-Isochrysis_galbana.AAC.2